MSRPAVLGGDGSTLQYPKWPLFGRPEREALERVLTSGQWSGGGPFGREVARTFAELHTARHGLCVTNGSTALRLALEALDIGRDDEVIVPGLTWQATAFAVLAVKAIPVIVDVEPETYCLDPVAAEAGITTRTKAIIPVHLYNATADIDALIELAVRHDLYVIEDCAHSHGTQWKNRGVGSFGHIGCFSFQQSKTLTAGEGGCIITSDDEVMDRLESLHNCGRLAGGSETDQEPTLLGGNERMSEWQAAILYAQLGRFESQVLQREQNRRWLDATIAQTPGIRPLAFRPQVTRHGAYAYVFRYDESYFAGLSVDGFRAALAEELEIPVSSAYAPLNQESMYRPKTTGTKRLRGEYAESQARNSVPLPVCERAFCKEAVVLPHELLLGDKKALALLPEAISRLSAYASELKAWEERKAR